MRVGIIPARGGSKRIPLKNIRPFCGQPIMAYTIQAARQSGCFDRIIVSTDDTGIAAVATQLGAEVPFLRTPELSTDTVHIRPVLCDAIQRLRSVGDDPEFICMLMATAPFLQADDLRTGLQRLQTAPDKNYAISVTTFPFPIQRAIRITAEGGLAPFEPDSIQKRSQDLEEAYHDAGQFFWGRTDAILAGAQVFGPGTIPIILPRHRVQDIDTLEDWTRAEALFRSLQQM